MGTEPSAAVSRVARVPDGGNGERRETGNAQTRVFQRGVRRPGSDVAAVVCMIEQPSKPDIHRPPDPIDKPPPDIKPVPPPDIPPPAPDIQPPTFPERGGDAADMI
jgi:hypothetical protein